MGIYATARQIADKAVVSALNGGSRTNQDTVHFVAATLRETQPLRNTTDLHRIAWCAVIRYNLASRDYPTCELDPNADLIDGGLEA